MESTAQHLGVPELKRDTYNDAAPDRVAHHVRSKLQFATTSEVRNVATKPSGTDYLFLFDIVRLPDRAAWTGEWALFV